VCSLSIHENSAFLIPPRTFALSSSASLRHGDALVRFSQQNDSDNRAQLDDSSPASVGQKDRLQENEFDSLDVVLERARKRNQLPLFLGGLLATFQRPAFPRFLTWGDVIFVLVAVFLNAKGFAVGLVAGKASEKSLQQWGGVPPTILQFWPVGFAILLDQFI